MLEAQEEKIGIENTERLFKYLLELSRAQMKPVPRLSQEDWVLRLEQLPSDERYVQIGSRDRVDDDEAGLSSEGEALLKVERPSFRSCPSPGEELAEWLYPGWDDAKRVARVRQRLVESENAPTFSDDERRVAQFEQWRASRDEWVAEWRHLDEIRALFDRLYNLRTDLQRDADTVELMVGTGFLTDREGNYDYPVFSKRVRIEFNSKDNIISILDVESKPEINGTLLFSVESLDGRAIDANEVKAVEEDYHPLDRNETPGFLKRFSHELSSSCSFSPESTPEFKDASATYLVYMGHALYTRKKRDGSEAAIKRILEAIDGGRKIPDHLLQIVSGGTVEVPERDDDLSIEQALAEIGGESEEILLTKEANKEQLEIAHRIEDYSAVLVQGPPGTGKTHTIANLMGNFLAQGKSVLVTSHTSKALSVLKEKMVPEMRGLCVSHLDDSNADMERSVSAISEQMARTDAATLNKRADETARRRRAVIEELANTRRRIFESLNDEYECIVYQGEGITPSSAARFLLENDNLSSVIPGKIEPGQPLPLTRSEMIALYATNPLLTPEDECEIRGGLPRPEAIADASDFSAICDVLTSSGALMAEAASSRDWLLIKDRNGLPVRLKVGNEEIALPAASKEDVQAILAKLAMFDSMEEWLVQAIADGKRGSAYRDRWVELIQTIKTTAEFAEKDYAAREGRTVMLPDSDTDELLSVAREAFDLIEKRGKISSLQKMLHRGFNWDAFEEIRVDGDGVASLEGLKAVEASLQLRESREKCSRIWDELVAANGGKAFAELDDNEPERIAGRFIEEIEEALNWEKVGGKELEGALGGIHVSLSSFYVSSKYDNDRDLVEKRIAAVREGLIPFLNITEKNIELRARVDLLERTKRVLSDCATSSLCARMLHAVEAFDAAGYELGFDELRRLVGLEGQVTTRMDLLDRLKVAAPAWAASIAARDESHGAATPPDNYEDAWKWKQLSMRLDEIGAMALPELQEKAAKLGEEYRRTTAKLASERAWASLLERTESNVGMRQALVGWATTVKKIGKGTGKRAPRLRADARRLMAQCQDAVPAWIMTVGNALNTLDPAKNRFDVVIVDEASQASIAALPVLFMAEKVIIVGDDKQVSPMGIGKKSEKTDRLIADLLEGHIPNSHLYTDDTSLYDIAGTTFKPLMLREHFRCVPDIIGFSDMLSYDGKIEPLRDATSSNLLPAIVGHRVETGERNKNKNEAEAREIACLMKACADLPEYKGKTFGAISMLSSGKEQVELINKYALEMMGAAELEERHFLCGNPSNFQGDERDVIWLSLVDSHANGGPLPMKGDGNQGVHKKRFNVAVSRAKDQLWVVNSLDWKNDLKSGDLRRRLLEYADDPSVFRTEMRKIERSSESPFEEAVAKALVSRGFRIVQQWKAGSYRIDIVAEGKDGRVAIECDGERFHSTSEQVRNDMERQAILERVGWRFIRLRGSEYYRQPEAAIEGVVEQLLSFGIEPHSASSAVHDQRDSELLGRVEHGAARYLSEKYGLAAPPILEAEALLGNRMELPGAVAQLQAQADLPQSVGRQVTPGVTAAKPSPVESSPAEKGRQQRREKTEKRVAGPEMRQCPVANLQIELPAQEDDGDWVVATLEAQGLQFYDMRDCGGCLWVYDGKGSRECVRILNRHGASFSLTKVKGARRWWMRGYPERND